MIIGVTAAGRSQTAGSCGGLNCFLGDLSKSFLDDTQAAGFLHWTAIVISAVFALYQCLLCQMCFGLRVEEICPSAKVANHKSKNRAAFWIPICSYWIQGTVFPEFSLPQVFKQKENVSDILKQIMTKQAPQEELQRKKCCLCWVPSPSFAACRWQDAGLAWGWMCPARFNVSAGHKHNERGISFTHSPAWQQTTAGFEIPLWDSYQGKGSFSENWQVLPEPGLARLCRGLLLAS